MSLSTQDKPTNPAKFFLKLGVNDDNTNGAISYYDKEQSSNIDVPTPFGFIVLDQLATIKGWSESEGSGFWSNEVKSSGHDPVTVRTSSGVKASGIWKDIKNEPSLVGAKFNASVYVAHRSGDGLVISNIAFKGAALSAWIKFIQANKGVMKGKHKVVISGFTPDKKGAVKFFVPVFEATDITTEEVDIATELDRELQVYLHQYLNYKAPDEPAADIVIEDIPEEPINIEDIPF